MVTGAANPYFGSPFLYDYQVFSFYEPEVNNDLRAVLAYEPDFTKNQGWTRWLGRHRFIVVGTQQKDNTNNLRYGLVLRPAATREICRTPPPWAGRIRATSSTITTWARISMASPPIRPVSLVSPA